jgi:protease I
VLLAARAKTANGQSVLYGRKTTALTKTLELSGWALTCAWMGRYYRTYPQVLQDEVKSVLQSPNDFISGPPAITRDSPHNLSPGFTVKDGNYLSARWPGDAHLFAQEFLKML